MSRFFAGGSDSDSESSSEDEQIIKAPQQNIQQVVVRREITSSQLNVNC